MSAAYLYHDAFALFRERAGDTEMKHSRIQPLPRRIEDHQYKQMEAAFARTGGLASRKTVERLLHRHAQRPLIDSVGNIADRSVLTFQWNTQTLIPLFQFNMTNMSLRVEVDRVVRELVAVFDDWDTALWFAQPNSWLQSIAPVDAIQHDHEAVFQAARADRFIAGI